MGSKVQIVSLSGGKDSTAMLLEMLKRNEHIDEVIFADTTVEFPAMYEHLEQVEKYTGLKITRLEPEHDFEYYLSEHKKMRGNKQHVLGYGFPTSGSRWCTAMFKRDAIKRYLKEKYPGQAVCQCIGLAADEPQRVDQELLEKGLVRYPLIEYGITEADALKLAYSCGFSWGGAYEFKHRLSCWCCPLQSLDDLRVLFLRYPKLWERLKLMQAKSFKPFRLDYTLEALEKMFTQELRLKVIQEN